MNSKKDFSGHLQLGNILQTKGKKDQNSSSILKQILGLIICVSVLNILPELLWLQFLLLMCLQ